MSTVFYMGQSAPLYAVIIIFTVIAMMIVSVVDVWAFWKGVRKETPSAGSIQPILRPNIALAIFIGLSYGAMIPWWVNLGSLGVGGYKINWITSSMVISSFPLMLEAFGVFFDRLPTIKFQLNVFRGGKATIESTTTLKESLEFYDTTWFAKFMFSAYFLSFVALLTMSVACLLTFHGTPSPQLANVSGQLVYTTALLIFLFVLGDAVHKRWGGAPVPQTPTATSTGVTNTETQGLISKLEEKQSVQSIDLTKLKLKDNLENYKDAPPLTFSRTGSLAFPRDVPENLFLHTMEREQLRPRTTGALDHKDFVAIQTSEEKVLLMDSKKGNFFLEEVPGGELNFPRTGMLTHALNGSQEAYKNSQIDPIIENERYLFRIFEKEPGVLLYQDGVLGFGPGNGIFVSVPGCLPWFLFTYFLAVDMQIWRDAGYGLVFSLLCNLPAVCFCISEHQRSYLRLMFLNRMLACAAVVVSGLTVVYNPTNKKYLMTTDVLYDNSSIWMQNATYSGGVDNAGELGMIVSVAFTSYLTFTSVCLWSVYCIVRFFVLKRGTIKPV